jgi:acrylyl-CoA reductase (NADPH)
MFQALQLTDKDTIALTQLNTTDLPEGDVTVSVSYSTINYKDALAVTGSAPIAKSYPMVPGIDFSGVVTASDNSDYAIGDKVVLNGWGVGEKHWGGFAQQARVKGKWLIKLPQGLSEADAMRIGTAGYTAMLCCNALREHGVTPASGPIIVSGATGGVGSIAVHILAKRGYEVHALSGKPEQSEYLQQLGAKAVIDRKEYSDKARALGQQIWAGAVDVAGSFTLANIIANTQYGGVVTACGLAQGMDLPSSVAPFILRGVSLVGVDSVYCPVAKRQAAWNDLAAEMDIEQLSDIAHTIGLDEVEDASKALMAGTVTGRYLVDLQK